MISIKTYYWFPILGIVLFILLYIYASTFYPGGSQKDLSSVGYDWINNYWCNLLNEQSMNGQYNPARPIAIFAMLVLCSSMSVFFIQFGNEIAKQKLWKRMIQFGGLLSMGFAIFMFSSYHDLMTTLSSFFGLFAVIGILRALYLSDYSWLKFTGLLCLILLAVNNYIYYSEHGLNYLPLIQKFTIVAVLLWIIFLQITMVINARS